MPDKEARGHDMTEQTAEWNYQKVYDKVAAYALDGEPLRAHMIFNALAKREGQDVLTGLTAREWDWLQWNIGYVKRIVNNRLMAALIFLTHRSGWASFNVLDVAKKTGYLEPQVSRYARDLEAKGLLKRHVIEYDKRVYYVASIELPTINKIIVELIIMKHGIKSFEDMLKPSEAKMLKHSKYMQRVTQSVKKTRLKNRRGIVKLRDMDESDAY